MKCVHKLPNNGEHSFCFRNEVGAIIIILNDSFSPAVCALLALSCEVSLPPLAPACESCLQQTLLQRHNPACDTQTINNNSVNGSLSAFKCLLISLPGSILSLFVIIKTVCCDATRARSVFIRK